MRRGDAFGRICLCVCVCLSVSNALIFESIEPRKFTFWYAGTSSEASGEVRLSRSSGQGQDHRSKKSVCVSTSPVVCLLSACACDVCT